MRIVVPVSSSDVHFLPDFMAALVYIGGLEDHYVTFVPTPTVAQVVKEAASKLEEICPNVNVVALSEDPVPGWPGGCNNHFAHTCSIVAAQPEPLPWLWMEIDSVGLEGWANKLGNAYSNLGNNRSFMGFIQPHMKISAATKRPTQAPGDDRLSGVAIYPWDMANRPNFAILLQDLGYGNRTGGEGFDEYLRFEMKTKGSNRAHTDLIDDRWNTLNYRVEDGQIVCDSGPKDRSERERGGIVNPQAVLVHGCKDGSLHRLVASGKAPAPTLGASIKKGEVLNIAEASKEGGGKQDAILAALQGISGQIATINTRVNAIENAAKVKPKATEQSPAVRRPALPKESDSECKGSMTAEKLRTFITTSGKSQTLKGVANHFDVPKSVVEDFINAEDSGFVVSGMAGWVKIAETATA